MTDTPQLLLCDCAGSMRPDGRAIEAGCGIACGKVQSGLCRGEAQAAIAALKTGPVIIACGQEAETFRELAEDLDVPPPLTVDIRDRAGWSDDAAGPKMAALIAEARLPAPALPTMDVASEGVCLVYGAGDVALAAAERLAGVLTVTCMLADAAEATVPGVDVVSGRIRRAEGALGRFTLEVDRFAELAPSGRGARAFGAPVDGARSACDLIVDLSGGAPLFPAAHKRDGYLRADPGRAARACSRRRRVAPAGRRRGTPRAAPDRVGPPRRA